MDIKRLERLSQQSSIILTIAITTALASEMAVVATVNDLTTPSGCGGTVQISMFLEQRFTNWLAPPSTTSTLPQTAISDSSSPQTQDSGQVEDCGKVENEASPSPSNSTITTIAVVTNAALPYNTATVAPQTERVRFNNCAEVNAIHPWGVAKSLAADKRSTRSKIPTCQDHFF